MFKRSVVNSARVFSGKNYLSVSSARITKNVLFVYNIFENHLALLRGHYEEMILIVLQKLFLFSYNYSWSRKINLSKLKL